MMDMMMPTLLKKKLRKSHVTHLSKEESEFNPVSSGQGHLCGTDYAKLTTWGV